MLKSTHLTYFLKIQSVSGMVVSIIVLIAFTASAVIGPPGEDIYVAIWYSYFVGLPIYGVLYVGLKLREYLREILAVLLKQQT